MSYESSRGSYVGVPHQRVVGGFGRRISPGDTAPEAAPAEAFTLSSAAQDFIAQERARNAQLLSTAQAEAANPQEGQPPTPLVNDIDYFIGGSDNQYVEIELDPGEAVIAEIGTMIWKDRAIGFEAILGDGQKGGVLGALASAGTNALSGEALFMGEFRHCGTDGKARVALGGRNPGHILPIRLEAMGGTLICQKGSFLAAAKGISVSVKMVSSFWAGVNGGTGFILQRLSGTGWAFLQVSGALIERELKPGESIHVEPGCIAAMEPGVQYDSDELTMPGGGALGNLARGIKAEVAGVRNMECARLTGPGKVWLQSLPIIGQAGAAQNDAPSAASSFLTGGAIAAGHAVGTAAASSFSAGDIVGDIGKLFDR
jgi:uncharacterized protein (AIM24 family)